MSEAELYGRDLFGEVIEPPSRGALADEFLLPPFSILNAREGWWQARKRQWLLMGIESEVGRGDCGGGLTMSETVQRLKPSADQTLKRALRRAADEHSNVRGERKMPEWAQDSGLVHIAAGTSIFDPVLCELVYRWWCPAGGQVVDPFAGGSVRGLIASMLGLHYWGCDLRAEQVEANQAQAAALTPTHKPVWVDGDAMDEVPRAPDADFVFSCPPYGDLEKYSDDPRDLSAMDHHAFVAAYKRIIMRACERLKPNRFACFVVGDFRDNKGILRNFVSETIGAFQEQRAMLYNEAILITQVGSLAIRGRRIFESSRKLGKTHQNVLVFVKGDPRKAADACRAEMGQ